MNDRLSRLRLFVRAARTSSFSSAGHELGLSQPTASRLIAALEEEIGATLFSRTTRAVALTEVGATYLVRIESILAPLDDADREARGTGELRGTLRVGASSSFVLREIIPRLSGFLRQHTALKIELVTNDRHQYLVTEGIDVAFRLGALPDSSAMARKIMHVPKVLVASLDYPRERGAPITPSDLAHHSVIVGPAHSSSNFCLRKDGRVTSVRVASQLVITIGEGARASAVAGLAIAASKTVCGQSSRPGGSCGSCLSGISARWKCTLYRRKDHKACRTAFADFLARGSARLAAHQLGPQGLQKACPCVQTNRLGCSNVCMQMASICRDFGGP